MHIINFETAVVNLSEVSLIHEGESVDDKKPATIVVYTTRGERTTVALPEGKRLKDYKPQTIG